MIVWVRDLLIGNALGAALYFVGVVAAYHIGLVP